MPADVVTFDMLRENVLASLSIEDLSRELQRAWAMQAKVLEYDRLVRQAMANKR